MNPDKRPSLIPAHRHQWEPIDHHPAEGTVPERWVYVCTNVVGCPYKGGWVSPRKINRKELGAKP
jgi:hypothetical protein